VIAANAIAATAAASECGESNYWRQAADTKPPSQAGRITVSASKPIGSANAGHA